jgi:hypothetical protein
MHLHRGIDLEAGVGRPVLAVERARVEKVYRQPRSGFHGYGRVVVLKLKSGPWALYAHLASVSVLPGQYVVEGQELGTVGQSQFRGGDPGDDRRMGAHLHFELAKRAYPLAPEADRGIDPVRWLRARGVPQSEEHVAGPPDAPPPSSEGELARAPRAVGPNLRAELMRRVIETDLRVATASRLLTEHGAEPIAEALRERWTGARGTILASLNGPSPTDDARSSVSAWLATVREARELLASLPSAALREAGATWTAAQHTLWTAGQWMVDRAEEVIDAAAERAGGYVRRNIVEPAAMAAGGVAGVVLLLLGAWAIGGGGFAVKRARATRELPAYIARRGAS